ncbi:MAG TPA: hypothetical protein VHM20_07945, partial [Gammaproteobacteria bacterium]|nr:hypothetical protein [Gammaproteobacteria bacterium]
MQSAYLNTISKIMELPLASDQATFYIFIIFWIVLIYYYIAWKKTHPPLKRVFIESEAEPTPIYSPAAMRYIRRMRFDITVLIAAFLDLAVKGYVVLESKFLSSSSLTPKKNHSDASLSEEERDIFAIMQKSDNFFGLKPQRKVLQIKKALKKSLVAQYKNTYFIYHTPYLMIGILISLAIFPIL